MRLPAALLPLLPAGWRIRGGRVLATLAAAPALMRVARLRTPPKPPRLHYGHERVPRRDEAAHGGMVKVQWMQDAFPAAAGDFNILYLVSSSLPRGVVALAALAARRGARIVWNQDGVAYPGWQPQGWEEANRPLRTLLRRADYVFYQSGFCRRAADRFLGPSPGPWEILQNPVDTTVFHPAQAGVGADAPTLLLGGNQDQWYRLESALRALRALHDRGTPARLLVSGRLGWDRAAAAKARARALVIDLRLADFVELTGPYTQRDAPALLRRADVLLHTKYNDPCPGVVIEALACGVPVVYSASGGVPELVGADAGIGIPVPEGWDRDFAPDAEAVATAIQKVLAQRDGYAAAARRRAVERFDLGPWLDRHRDVFERLLQ